MRQSSSIAVAAAAGLSQIDRHLFISTETCLESALHQILLLLFCVGQKKVKAGQFDCAK